MAGAKTFINNTGKELSVTLYIRMSENPANSAGSKQFNLSVGQSEYVSYGDAVNIYLNGISVASISDGAIIAEQEFVITRGSNLDNQLNMNDTVTFTYPGGGFQISTSNS